ncbi:transporter substrate-binding domain-containing protein [Roseomonas sp. GC11]|uniref:transporter substrate-binding domain-containing protein n=1 Tax=Roseomonas sp. GC11 TaxID=2950546 RepID=UPI002109F66B|nr:transporter substrate-binding domain-containing protein [Roseomonas sp. GC11]MCQ4160179.1 transporter substrate-binding domain-containing protein [Roseomonas sp. GC11]
MSTRRLLLGLAGALLLGGQALAQSCAPKVPAASLLEAGKWQMSINPTLPPQQFVDSRGELQGLNVELARAIAAKLCVEPVFLRMDFPPMIPGLRAGRFDTINTGLFWTEERSKLFYMVPYAQQAISIYTLPNSSLAITKFDDLSGRVVGIESATYQERKSREVNAEMVARGLKPIDFRTFSTASETVAALRAGQLEAAINIDETVNDLVQKKVAKAHLQGLFGTDITLAFRDRAMAEGAAAALTALKADGTYDRLFDRFGMTRLQAESFAIRGPGPAAN